MIWLLAKKDLALFSRDKVGLLLGFLLPIVLATVFGAAVGSFSGSGEMPRASLFVEDHDDSEASRALLAALEGTGSLRVRRVEGARERVAEGDGAGALIVAEGYGAALDAGEPLPLLLLRDPSRTVEQQILSGSLVPALFEVAGDALVQRAMDASLDLFDFPEQGRALANTIMERTWDEMSALAEANEPTSDAEGAEGAEPGDEDAGGNGFDFAAAIPDLMGIEVEDVVGGTEHAAAQKAAQQSHAVSGIAVMMLLFGLVATGGSLIDEQNEGTLDRLRLAPGTANAILWGKFLSVWIIGLVQLVILFVYGKIIFDVAVFHAPVALLVLSMAVAAAATGFGILFACVCRTRKQLEGISTLVILTMSSMGGSWFPLIATPDWFQFLGHFTLNAWAMDGYQGIFWYQKGLAGILPEIAVLAAIALGTSLLAAHFWKRRRMA